MRLVKFKTGLGHMRTKAVTKVLTKNEALFAGGQMGGQDYIGYLA